MTDKKYDSTQDTLDHIFVVSKYLVDAINNLNDRMLVHDSSKLESPEKEAFDSATPKLKSLTYGSDEYKESLREIQEALKHHYAKNRHHPEHWEKGIDGMSLFDLIEMLCDWKAAGERHKDGSIEKSLEINQKRFMIGPQLQNILENTTKEFGWM